jgi:hypothetical protein
VAPRSESHSPSWATHNPRRLCERITPLHMASWTKRSNRNDQKKWTCDTIGQFDVYWRPGREHIGDYHTNHHSAQHHKDMRHLILHEANSLQALRGCVKLARPHGCMDKSKRPESHPTKECTRAGVRCLNTEPNYCYCPITLVMSWLITLAQMKLIKLDPDYPWNEFLQACAFLIRSTSNSALQASPGQ